MVNARTMPALRLLVLHSFQRVDAALTIQRAWSAFTARRWLGMPLYTAAECHEWDAAITIQHAWWTFAARRWPGQPFYTAAEWQVWDAATTIQRAWCLARYGPYAEEPDPDDHPLVGETHYLRYVGGRHSPEVA